MFFPPIADDNATIRVTNLSEDTRETDLQELFRPFGSISRIYLAKDKNTGQSKVSECSSRALVVKCKTFGTAFILQGQLMVSTGVEFQMNHA